MTILFEYHSESVFKTVFSPFFLEYIRHLAALLHIFSLVVIYVSTFQRNYANRERHDPLYKEVSVV